MIMEVVVAPGPVDVEEMGILSKAQREDPNLSLIKGWLEFGAEAPGLSEILCESEKVKVYWYQRESQCLKADVLCRRIPEGIEQVLVPKPLRQEFMKMVHKGLTVGHLGVMRTRWQVRRCAHWLWWSKDVKQYCKECPQCNLCLSGPPPRQGPLKPVPCGEPWERVSLDITGPHPRSKHGHVYILIMMDNFTKFVEAAPLRNEEAVTVAIALVETVVVRYGVPSQNLTDQGPEF